MRAITRIIVSVLVLFCSEATQAQQLSSAYFMDGFAYGHELNPAKDYDRAGYFSLPFLPSNLSYSNRGNLGLTDLFRRDPNGDGLITYLHPSLSTDDALSKFTDENRLMSDIRYDLLSFGFRTKHAYQNFTLALRTSFDLNMPYEFFDLTKNIEKRNYSINDLNLSAKGWFEMGWGYSREVANFVRVGGKLKVMLGIGTAGINMNSLDLKINSSDNWAAKADVQMEVGMRGFTWGETTKKEYSDAYLASHPDSPKEYDVINLSNFDFEGPSLKNFGMGVDLGTEIDFDKANIVPGLKFSAAIVDLGFINWKDVATARNQGDEFVFKGFKSATINADNSVEFDNLDDCISNLFSLQDAGTISKKSKIGATLNIGVEYALPVYKKLTFGLLSTTHFKDKYSWNEERISVNIHPTKWFEAGMNIGVGTLGKSFGWIANLHTNGFNVFVGGDHVLGENKKEILPLNNTTNIALGINFPISNR